MRRLGIVLAVALLVGITASALANPFGAGNLVVLRVGNGAAALSNAATPDFLMEYTTAGGFVQTIDMPAMYTNSGTATSEGFLTLSVDGNYLTAGGYYAAVGTAGVATTANPPVSRVIARVDMAGNVDTTTALTDAWSGMNIRSAVSVDGNEFWGTGSGQGVRYATPLGATTSTQLNTAAPTNLRVDNIYNGQLYVSSATGAFQGISKVGTGLPTTGGQTITLLPGFPTATGPQPYDFWFADDSTLYVADDRAVTNGGIQKWVFGGTTWSLSYTMNTSLTTGCRGLTGEVVGGNVVLYATTTETNANKLVTVTDLGAASPFTVLATAPANTAFRGVDFATPEPATLALLAFGGLALIRRR